MAMPDLRLIRQVLREKLLTVAGVKHKLIAPENRNFTPPADEPLWIREHLLPDAFPKVATMTVEGVGRAQFDVVTKKGGGTEAAEDLVKLICQAFEPSTHIPSQGIQIAIDRCDASPGRAYDSDWWFIPISISWRIYTQTAA